MGERAGPDTEENSSTTNDETDRDSKQVSMAGAWIAIGAGVGAAVGVAIDNIGVGIAVGVAIGAAFSGAQVARSKQK